MSKSNVVNSILQVFTSKLLAQVMSLGLIFYISRNFGLREMAVLPGYLMMAEAIILIFNFGTFPTMVKLIPSLLDSDLPLAMSIAKTAIYINAASAVFASVAIFLLSDQFALWVFDDIEFSYVIKILSIGFMFVGLNILNQYILNSFSRFLEMAKIIVYQNMARVLITFSLAYAFGFEGLVWGITISAVLSFFISFYPVRNVYFYKVKAIGLKEIFNESWSFYFEGYASYIRKEGDNLIITSMLSAEFLSIYFIAKKIFGLLDGFFRSTDSVLTAKLSSSRNDFSLYKEQVVDLRKVFIYSMLPITLFYVSFVPTFIYFLGGEKFAAAQVPAIFLSLVPVFRYFFEFSYTRAIFIFLPSLRRFYLTAINTIILLVAAFLFTEYFGLNGIAFSILLSSILAGWVALFMAKKYLFNFELPVADIISITIIGLISITPIVCAQLYYFKNFFILGVSAFVAVGLNLSLLYFFNRNLLNRIQESLFLYAPRLQYWKNKYLQNN